MTPAAPTPPPPEAPTHDEQVPLKFGLGADAHLQFGELIHTNVGARGELLVAPQHSIVLRGGVGSVQWMDSESDDPIYREWFVRVGYRLSSTHVFAGVELGRSWYKAHYDAIDMMPAHDGKWFGETTATGLVGIKLGPIDLGVDYTRGSQSFGELGVFIGAGYRQR